MNTLKISGLKTCYIHQYIKKRIVTKTCTNLKNLYFITWMYWSFEFRCGSYKWREEWFVIIPISLVMLFAYYESSITSEAGVHHWKGGMLRYECLPSLLLTAAINLTWGMFPKVSPFIDLTWHDRNNKYSLPGYSWTLLW